MLVLPDGKLVFLQGVCVIDDSWHYSSRSMKEGVRICWTRNVEWKLKELLIVFILLNPRNSCHSQAQPLYRGPQFPLCCDLVTIMFPHFQLESGEEVEVEEFYVKFKGL